MRRLIWKGNSTKKQREVKGNPYCGFYTIYRFLAHEDLVWGWNCPVDELNLDKDQSICLLQFNLQAYNKSALRHDALKRIEKTLEWFRAEGKGMIVRFLYDWDGRGLEGEPHDIGIILKHMQQLGPILKDLAPHIHILQGLFMGSWGEMHTSRYLDRPSMYALAHQLYESSGQDSFIAVRCPNIWRSIFGTYEPLSPTQAYGDNMAARFGLFNDGLLASHTDNGTYGTIHQSLSMDYGDKLVPREEMKFQKHLCLYVPNGGETVGLTPYHEFKNARRTFSQIHISYLNSHYDSRVLDRWRAKKTGLWSSLWRERTIYDYMASHLGYRFLVRKVYVKSRDKNSGIINIELKLVNKGFASPYRAFELALIVQSVNTPYNEYHPIESDTRYWLPNTPITILHNISYKDWREGQYILGLKIRDPASKKDIQLANAYPQDPKGIPSLGYFSIGPGGNHE